MDEFSGQTIAAAAGLIGGIVLGLAARLGRFCTLAAIEDAMFAGNTTRWRIWVLAMGLAIFATQFASAAGLVDLSQSMYARAPFNALSVILGGLMFGIGMAMVGTCGFGTLVRLGGGDLKSLLVFLVIGISAFMAAAGPTARLRQMFLDPFDIETGVLRDARADVVFAEFTGLPGSIAVVAIGGGLVAWALSQAAFRRKPNVIVWSGIVAAAIVFGWLGTGWLARDPFEPVPVQSFSFIQPLGATLMYVMTSTGSDVGFGTGATLGVVAGAFVGANIRREFRWEASDDAIEARRQIAGAFLMGTGGMFALGCTIGQGLTGVSALAISAPIALAAIWLGAWLGLVYLFEGSIGAIVSNLFRRRS